MREILFKAKRISDGKWVEGYYIYHIKRTICPIGDIVKPEDEQHAIMCDGFSAWNMPRDTVHFDIDPNTLCQFTGLKDKDGNKIWENDIVHFHETQDDICVIRYGEYNNNTQNRHIGFYTDWQTFDFIFRQDLGFWIREREFEVIGNVFDNPELLEYYRQHLKPPDQKESIKRIADHYGYFNQSQQLIEEMCELTVAISHMRRCNDYEDIAHRQAVFEEIADVEVMLEQMKYLLTCDDEVEAIKDHKIKRQLERMGQEGEYAGS